MRLPIIILLTITSINSVSIFEDLRTVCPTYESILEKNVKSKKIYEDNLEMNKMVQGVQKNKRPTDYLEPTKVTFVNDIDLINIDRLKLNMMSGLKPIGEGSFGQVFISNLSFSKFDELSESDEKVAVKLQRVNNNYTSREGKFEQNMLFREININMMLNQVDQTGFLFPEFLKCYDLTKLFNDVATSQTRLTVKQRNYFTSNFKQELMVIMMEKLDLSLFSYLQFHQQNLGSVLKPNDRLAMAYNLVYGLKIMNSVILHCDIKPENIMLKQVSGTEIFDKILNNGLFKIELNKNTHVIIKYIDFGLSNVNRSDGKMTCPGGTPGFVPRKDSLRTSEKYTKFDVYGLGITFLDIELSATGFGFYSDFAYALFEIKETKKFDSKKFLKLIIVQRVLSLIDNQDYRAPMKKAMYERDPNYENFLKQIDPNVDINTVQLSNFLFLRGDLLKFIVDSCLDVFYNHYLEHVILKKKNEKYLQRKNDIEKEKLKLSGQDIQELDNELEYLDNKYQYDIKNVQLRRDYYNVFLKMTIEDSKYRISVDDLLIALKKLKTNFDKAVFDIEDDIFHYENEMPDEDSIQSINYNTINDLAFKKRDFIVLETSQDLQDSGQEEDLDKISIKEANNMLVI